MRDDYGFVKQSELSVGWVVSVKQELRKMDVSEDEELLALLSEKGKIYIWNLKVIPTVFRKNMNLSELGDNSCSFSFDDPIEQLEFKTSIKEKKNCLYALSKNNLRVMQEVRDGSSFNFVNLISIRVNGLRSFIQINSSIDSSKQYDSSALSFNNMVSVDPIILQVDNRFIFYELYNIRSQGIRGEYKEIKQLDIGLDTVKSVLFTNKQNLFIVGEEGQNVCQIKLKLNENNFSRQYLKVYFMDISECYFS